MAKMPNYVSKLWKIDFFSKTARPIFEFLVPFDWHMGVLSWTNSHIPGSFCAYPTNISGSLWWINSDCNHKIEGLHLFSKTFQPSNCYNYLKIGLQIVLSQNETNFIRQKMSIKINIDLSNITHVLMNPMKIRLWNVSERLT